MKKSAVIVAEARKAGEALNCVELARRFGIHKQTVYKILRAAHAEDPRVPLPNRKRPNPRRDAVMALARQGHSSREISAFVRMPHKTVQAILARAREAGEAFPPPRGGGRRCGWGRMAVDDDVREMLSQLATDRRMTGAQLLNSSLRALLQEPVVLDNLLMEDTP